MKTWRISDDMGVVERNEHDDAEKIQKLSESIIRRLSGDDTPLKVKITYRNT